MTVTDLVLVSVPVSPGGRHLPAQLAGAGPVVVDEVVQRHVGQGHLVRVRYDEGALNVCKCVREEGRDWLVTDLSPDSCPVSPP